MIKQFKVFFLIGMLASSVFAANCGDKGSDNSGMALLLLAGGAVSNGSVTFFDGISYTWDSSGFGNPGGGSYQQSAVPDSGLAQFWIVLPGAGITAYDENTTNLITYNDLSGVTWVNDTSLDFDLSVTSWGGVGGYAEGTFSGNLLQFGGVATKYVSGSFNIKILN